MLIAVGIEEAADYPVQLRRLAGQPHLRVHVFLDEVVDHMLHHDGHAIGVEGVDLVEVAIGQHAGEADVLPVPGDLAGTPQFLRLLWLGSE